MPLNHDEMTKKILQTHCDQIIAQLEKAVQAAVYAKHFKSDNASDVQKTIEAAEQTKNIYFQTVISLYNPKNLPLIYTDAYNSAISTPTGTESYHSYNFFHSTEAYTIAYRIEASRIIQQLNDDFLPNQPRDSWVSYSKPHLNYLSEVTNKRLGASDYKMRWLDGSQEAPEEKTIYLAIMKDGLSYAVLDPDNQIKTGNISLDRILGMSLQEDQFNNSEDDLIYAEIEVDAGHIHLKNITPFSVITEEDEQPPIGTGVYQPIDLIKHADGLTYRVRSPSGYIQTGKLSLDNILELVKFEHIEHPDDCIYVEISEVNCYSFIIHILSHPIVQIVAIALLVIGAALALSGIAVGVGAGMAIIGGGILVAGFFAPKRNQENETLTPDFFAPNTAQESSPLV